MITLVFYYGVMGLRSPRGGLMSCKKLHKKEYTFIFGLGL